MALPVRVLFICIGNACRSPMAEAIARHDAANVIEASSAGLYPLGFLPKLTVETLARNGYSSEGLSSKGISRDAAQSADVIVNLSGMAIEPLFSSSPSRLREDQRIEKWNVSDPYGEDTATYQRILKELQQRVQGLAERLREEHPVTRR
jgi:arsenate reductase (thioredoxin)